MSVIAIVALLVVVLPRGEERVSAQHLSLDAAVADATERVTRADNVVTTDPAAALGLYRSAWAEIDGAATLAGDPDDPRAGLASRITTGLDSMRGGAAVEVRTLTAFEGAAGGGALDGFVLGPDDDLYVIDSVASVVTRIDAEDGERADIVHRGDRVAEGKARIGRPVQLERAGSSLLIVDDDARLWRWVPSDGDGDGTLSALDLGGDDDWSASIGDIATRPDMHGFRVYVVDPAAQNILRFQPTFDGRSFARSDYLVVDDEAVSGFRQLHIDERVYALTEDGVRRYEFGRMHQFRLEVPPDDADIRPGQDYQLIAGADRNGTVGHLYLYDGAWDRMVVFDKSDGAYVRQWSAPPGDPSMQDVLGLAVTTGLRRQPDTLQWLTPSGVYEAVVPWAAPAEEDDGEREGRREGRRKGRSR